jgi:hypothetical protein
MKFSTDVRQLRFTREGVRGKDNVGGFSVEIEKIQWNYTFFLHGFNVQVLRGKAYVGGLKESKIQVYQILANASSMTRWSIHFRTEQMKFFNSQHHQSP